MRSGILSGIALLSLSAACATGGAADPTGSTSTGTGAGGGAGGAGGEGGSGGQGVSVGVGGGGGSGEVTEVFGHSGDTLYRLDPTTNDVTEVGAFSGCGDIGGVLDIAIDKDNEIIAVKRYGLYRVDRLTASCTVLKEIDPEGSVQYPDSLGFVPEGTVDPQLEALVGYVDADYVRLDPSTGQMSTINAGALGSTYVSSGDVVSVIDGGTYLTVEGGSCADCIVEVDPTDGTIEKDYGDLGFDRVFGLAFWGGSAYGFSDDGELFEVVFGSNNVATTVIPIPNAPQQLAFWGAGSATSVPLEMPE